METAARQARAKINLWLNVVGRRSDGYHLLHSLVAFADLADTVEVCAAADLSLVVDGPTASTLANEPDNLVLKAARALAARAAVSPRAAIRLTKRIPVAAGLGGGSADAAAALQALSELWRVALPVDELFDLAATLGADVPMCLSGRTAIATGVGDRLEPAPGVPSCGVLLVNPRIDLPTARVFGARSGAAFSEARPVASAWRDLPELIEALAARGNDLTEAAISLRPEVGEVLSFLRAGEGARYAAMSGSGATCFAIYDTVQMARAAASNVPSTWWSAPVSLGAETSPVRVLP